MNNKIYFSQFALYCVQILPAHCDDSINYFAINQINQPDKMSASLEISIHAF